MLRSFCRWVWCVPFSEEKGEDECEGGEATNEEAIEEEEGKGEGEEKEEEEAGRLPLSEEERE